MKKDNYRIASRGWWWTVAGVAASALLIVLKILF